MMSFGGRPGHRDRIDGYGTPPMISREGATSKQCKGCGLVRPLDEFSIDKARVGDGRTARCRECLAAARRERRIAKPGMDRINERRSKARRGHIYLARQRDRRASDPVWRQRKREQDRRYRARPEAKQVQARKESLRRARLRRCSLAPFTMAQLKQRMSMWPGCWMCGGEWTQVDHVKPITKGGMHCLANLRPACKRCNGRKWKTWHGPAWAHGLSLQGPPC